MRTKAHNKAFSKRIQGPIHGPAGKSPEAFHRDHALAALAELYVLEKRKNLMVESAIQDFGRFRALVVSELEELPGRVAGQLGKRAKGRDVEAIVHELLEGIIDRLNSAASHFNGPGD